MGLNSAISRCAIASSIVQRPSPESSTYGAISSSLEPWLLDLLYEAFQDHGRVRESLTEDVDGARRTLAAFEAAGIDYEDVVQTLEREGVEKFANSFQQLFADVEAKRDQMVAA